MHRNTRIGDIKKHIKLKQCRVNVKKLVYRIDYFALPCYGHVLYSTVDAMCSEVIHSSCIQLSNFHHCGNCLTTWQTFYLYSAALYELEHRSINWKTEIEWEAERKTLSVNWMTDLNGIHPTFNIMIDFFSNAWTAKCQ